LDTLIAPLCASANPTCCSSAVLVVQSACWLMVMSFGVASATA
jgi:hypothetical protein